MNQRVSPWRGMGWLLLAAALSWVVRAATTGMVWATRRERLARDSRRDSP